MLYNRGMVPKATPSLLLENFRCFVAPREIPLAPLTFLVGGNSSGKTSFLAAIRLAWDAAMTGNTPNFSAEPFDLGSYHDIASFFGKEHEQAEKFYLGLRLPLSKFQHPSAPSKITVAANFIQSPDDHPLINQQVIDGEGVSVEINPGSAEGTISIFARFLSGSTIAMSLTERMASRISLWFLEFEHEDRNRKEIPRSPLTEEDLQILRSHIHNIESMLGGPPTAFAPVRTRPKRTYNPRVSTYSPEGEHTPMMLSSFLDSNDPGQKKLIKFGKDSGLFSNLNVRKFGEMGGDPFQIQAEALGYLRNVIDVGYGVSQALPIVVDTLSTPSEATLLIQQPEVHLHPKAQAEMGTIFAEQMQQRSAPIIVETHSDHMIDRIRLLIRKGQVRKEDVQVLFFSPKSTDVDIIPIALGDDGSIIDPPDDYRKFFLDEQLEFFS